jgi:hypothetical protein
MLYQFPNLAQEGYTTVSPATRIYNCIAWAAGRQDQWWWPDPGNFYFCPSGVPRAETLDVFFQAFAQMGYDRCDNGDLEAGFKKVAFYESAGIPTHAARQLLDGSWTSKLGKNVDITHTLRGFEEQRMERLPAS